MLNFTINESSCIQCGKCVEDCPMRCIVIEKGDFPTIPDEDKCIGCQHCLAICPTAALSINDVDPEKSMDLKYSLPTALSMETLIKGRRSTRRYKKQSVNADTIQQLLETAYHAPTGVNAQNVLFTTTISREITDAIGQEIYARLGEILPGKDPENDDVPHQYMRMAYKAHSEHGADIILRNAPHILIASAPKTNPLPKEDCLIALTTFDLLAPTMGVGTLWNGIFKFCIQDFFPDIADRLGVPQDHEVGYTMVFGLPGVQYKRTVQREPAKMSLVESL